MVNNSEKKEKVLKKQAFLILLIVLIIAFVIIAENIKPTLAHNTVSVGFVCEPNTYCFLPVISSPDSYYQVSAANAYDDLIDDLNNGTYDAALLPVGYLDALEGGIYSIVAVTSYLNLVAVENGYSVFSLSDLNGRTVIMPESVLDTLELSMLRELLSYMQVSVDMLFESDSAIQHMAYDNDFDILMLPADKCAAVLLQNENYRSCFNLASQWSNIHGTRPPAGYCIVARDESIKNKPAAISSLLTSVKASVNFVNSKHKKAAAYISASGTDADIKYIWKNIPYFMFEFLHGSDMTEPLEQLMILTE